MQPQPPIAAHDNSPAPGLSSRTNESMSFDAWMWQYIQAGLREKYPPSPENSGREFNDDEVEDDLELAWKFLKDRKYHQARRHCQDALEEIEHDLSRDFAYDLTRLTLYDDTNSERRACYLEALEVYRETLFGLVIELLLEADDFTDIELQYARYQELRGNIQQVVSKVTYLLGSNSGDIFFTMADLDEFDDLVREHLQFLLKREFFTTFNIVLETLGDLDRNDFHLVTEPYKNLRALCEHCLTITAQMKDERFFGPEDVFIEKYEHDVKVYLQILWYLGMKSDLNKIDKFLHPNTYSGGLDAQMQVFAAVALLQDILPHVQAARAVGFGAQATADVLEGYAEYWYAILKHEKQQIRNDAAKLADNAERLQHIGDMMAVIDRYTVPHPKTRRRVEFAHKFFRKTRMAFRLQDHNIIEVPNPEGRKLKDPALIADFLEALEAQLFTAFLQALRLQYRSRHSVNMQRLRWAWFAERELPAGFFETLHYKYLPYIHSRWKEKIQAHYQTLNELSQ